MLDFQHSNTPPLHGLEFTKGDDSGLNLALLRFQCGDYVPWDELVHVAAEAGYFFDEATADVGQLFSGHKKHRFQIRLQFAIHERELEFKLEVAHGT